MEKAMTILYEVHDNLYINLTNRCPCACTFCLRQTMDKMGSSDTLWLEHDVTKEELLDALSKEELSGYGEAVFCGFGEPTEALDVLLEGARFIKAHTNLPIRLNTNGMGNLIHGRDITPELVGLIDSVSISLNTPNADKYHALVRCKFGTQSFDAMLDFAKKCVACLPKVVLTTVDTTLTKEEEARCQEICEEIGATYRIRPWEE